MSLESSVKANPLKTILSDLPLTLIIGAIIVLAWLILALLAPWITGLDPNELDFVRLLQAPSWERPFGTDELGRDMLTRILYAARIDIWMGVGGVFFPMIIGITVGLFSGYFGGTLDKVLMRIVDVTMAFPFFILVLVIVAMLGPGLSNFLIALVFVGWVSYARLIRSEVQVLKKAEYIQAAQTMGLSHVDIIFRHILPNSLAPIMVYAVTDAVLVILLGSSLGFLGVGVQPPTPEWGAMIAGGKPYVLTAWWICFFPGMATLTLGVGLSLLGGGLAKKLRVKN